MLEKVKVRKLPDHEYYIYLICQRRGHHAHQLGSSVLVTLKAKIAFVFAWAYTHIC